MSRRLEFLCSLATIAFLAIGCGGGGGGRADGTGPFNVQPSFIASPILKIHYDGASDDLLTAGVGATGLQSAQLEYQNPLQPTAVELRRNALITSYRELVDTTDGGGFRRLYGPNVDVSGVATASEGLIAGTEYLAYADDGSGKLKITLLVQVPDAFDLARPCMVAAPPSGSRNVYGAITTGEWGLKRGCAVAYTDKGAGTGFHNLQTNTAQGIQGETLAADDPRANFRAPIDGAALAAFNATTPHRFAVKQAHSQQTPWADWGVYVLWSLEFAFYVLNEQFSTADAQGRVPIVITPANTLVIAAGVSNGGGASLLAAEQDNAGFIDAVVVAEPNV